MVENFPVYESFIVRVMTFIQRMHFIYLQETRRASTPGLEYTSNFQNLLLGIEKMIPASLEAKVSRHSR